MDIKKTAIISAGILACAVAPGLYNGLKVQHYSVESEKIKNNVRIALVTDLHSCRYGEHEQKLISRIDENKPDVILLGGDIFDHKIPDTNTECFLAGIAGKYPCYFVTGNHEYMSGEDAFYRKMSILEKYGVTRLCGEAVTENFNGNSINICGISDYTSVDYPFDNTRTVDEQLDTIKEEAANGNFTVLLSHRPELIHTYAKYGFDLVLAGHAHGGQWRIPYILNGTFSTGQGIFPKYAGGEYDVNGTKMIVSRGLARETTIVPRIYNRPELVIIDLN